MAKYRTQFGQPIYSPNKEDIWAFWREEHVFMEPWFRFKTVSQLLGTPDIPGGPVTHRTTGVRWDGTKWHAGFDTIQKDFAEHPSFMMHPHQGPEAALNALDLLLRHKRFADHFYGDTLHSLQMFRRILEEDARNSVSF